MSDKYYLRRLPMSANVTPSKHEPKRKNIRRPTQQKITVRIDEDLNKALDSYCKNKKRKPSDVLRSALASTMESEGFLVEGVAVEEEPKK